MMFTSIDKLWLSVLSLKKKVEKLSESVSWVNVTASLDFQSDDILVSFPAKDISNGVLISLSNDYDQGINSLLQLEYIGELSIGENGKEFLKLYLPYCFLSLLALKKQSCVAVSHFAQTIDGKIATVSGKSQWIGNEENLIHAHRMRALCTGILIGNNTLVNDDPSLSVRLVEGENPVKVVVGSKDRNRSKIEKDGKLVFVTPSSADGEIRRCFSKENNLNCTELLSYLFKKGIRAIYIEGGSFTTSSFLQANAIDVIQVHIAPIILGSGISSFVLPEADEIGDGKRYSKYEFYKIGGEVMFVGSSINDQ